MDEGRLTQSNRQAAGFTIVETIIVLAIAGLILMIVLIAIPALQRSSHNSQRRQDVSAILQATSSFMLRNSANFPSTSNLLDALSQSRLYFYEPIPSIIITVNQSSISLPGTIGPIALSNGQEVHVYNYVKCVPDSGTQGEASTKGADYRDVAAFYMTESSSGLVAQCQQM